MKVYFKVWLTVLALALGALVMITLVTQAARAAGPWYVAPGGDDSNDCLSPGAACATINGALGKADPDDTIYVATGTYTSTVSEVVLLDKDATLSGGWDAGFTTQSGTSTIDGEGSRRGITVNSGVTATVERFVVQNGSSTQGGGMHNGGTVALNNNTVTGNTASSTYAGAGIYNGGTVTLNDSTVSGNTAHDGIGGGMYNGGTVTLNDSTVSGNTAKHGGCGIYNKGSTLTLNNSTVSGNTAQFAAWGGGIASDGGTVTLNNSTVSGNTAYAGGGLHLGESNATLIGNIVNGNTAGWCGGLNFNDSDATLSGNTIISNTAHGYGGGLCVIYKGDVTLTNNVVVDNQANSAGSGLYIRDSSPRLLHTTIARNTGDGSGIYVTDYGLTYSNVVMTNTVLVSHTVGIAVTASNTATLESTL